MKAAHKAFFFLRTCFTIPLYLLCTSLCSSSPRAAQLDEVIKSALTSLCNLKLDTESWAQASLPVRCGGVGERSVVVLAPSALISSMHASGRIVQTILPAWARQAPDPALDETHTVWSTLGGENPSTGPNSVIQRAWDDGVCATRAAGLLQLADAVDHARLDCASLGLLA